MMKNACSLARRACRGRNSRGICAKARGPHRARKHADGTRGAAAMTHRVSWNIHLGWTPGAVAMTHHWQNFGPPGMHRAVLQVIRGFEAHEDLPSAQFNTLV